MFTVNEDDVAAIRQAYERGGEWVAVAEFRRRFPGVARNAEVLELVRSMVAWRSAPPPSE